MLVFHTRANEKILLPDAEASIEIVAIQSGSVRLAIRGPEDLRVMREQAQQAPAAETPPSLPMLRRLLEARLDIARKGIGHARDLLQAGRDEDASVLLEKVDEDLHLLRRRIRREFDKTDTLSCGV